jgi:hypothetical protein
MDHRGRPKRAEAKSGADGQSAGKRTGGQQKSQAGGKTRSRESYRFGENVQPNSANCGWALMPRIAQRASKCAPYLFSVHGQ